MVIRAYLGWNDSVMETQDHVKTVAMMWSLVESVAPGNVAVGFSDEETAMATGVVSAVRSRGLQERNRMNKRTWELERDKWSTP